MEICSYNLLENKIIYIHANFWLNVVETSIIKAFLLP